VERVLSYYAQLFILPHSFAPLFAMTSSPNCPLWLFPHLFSYNSFTWLSINSAFYSITVSYGRIRSLFPYLSINVIRVATVCEYGFDLNVVTQVGLWRMPMRPFFRYLPLACRCLEL
jgi:hypothetical protein